MEFVLYFFSVAILYKAGLFFFLSQGITGFAIFGILRGSTNLGIVAGLLDLL